MHPDPDLSALGALGGFFVLRTGEPPHGSPPTLAAAYAVRDDRGARAGDGQDPVLLRARKVAETLRTPETRVAASVAHQGFVARLWSVALGAAVVYGRVPDLDPRLLRWDAEAGAPDDLWLTEVRMLPVGALGELVREGHLAPLAEAVRARFRLPDGLLRGNAGSALLGAARQLDRRSVADGRTEAGDRARALAAELLAHPALSGALDPVTLRRRSCCLYYRVPGGGVCGDCCFDRPPRRT
ncbi:(2Fe-2S)-binding protein [Streptomyces sp. CRN 30]|uniref:(2Fe-2S)-binding protein n=1 Tax=Streptomyces sp. CRN 30 TaxID=3075613 RepID=UPI002A7F214A|nr:(2Fe-2S)-binding protein [Streptomyces sp. CRN 30]